MDNQNTINLANTPPANQGGFLKNNWVILLLIAIFIVIIIIMIPFIINILSQDDNYVQVEYTMEGYDGPITDSTIAFMFSENVANKLESDENYDTEDAIKNYEKVYNEVDDSLKFDIGLAFSDFLYSEAKDTDRAINVLREAKQYINEDSLDSLYYYNSWANMCNTVDDLNIEECANLDQADATE